MKFSEIKNGSNLYVLDRNTMTVGNCTVTAVGIPRADASMIGTNSLAIDATIDMGGKSMQYVFKSSEEDFNTPNGIMITPNRENIVREVGTIKMQGEQVLSQIDNIKERIEKCNTLLAELDPSIKERQATEKRFSDIEGSVSKIESMLEQVLKAVNKGKD